MALDMLYLGLGLLVAVAIGHYARIRAEKGWQWLTVAALFFLFSAAWEAPAVGSFIGSGAMVILRQIFELVGWLFTLLAAIFIAYELLIEK